MDVSRLTQCEVDRPGGCPPRLNAFVLNEIEEMVSQKHRALRMTRTNFDDLDQITTRVEVPFSEDRLKFGKRLLKWKRR